MFRYLPLLALVLVAFAAGVWWRRRPNAHEHGATGLGDYGVLVWVPIGGAVAVVLVAVLLALLDA